ncbi:MAG: UDP-N-acetylmuramate--L-alanine ligase [Tenacibaculum sp.]
MKLHFIAIGGSAMHNLAIALHKKGYSITGSDDAIYNPSKSRLKKYNLLPEKYGWFPEKISNDLDAVILGMHAKKDNEELLKAQKLRLKIYSYPEFLYQQSKHKTRVVIGGSHGKTSISAMILHVLNYCDIAVDYMIGAQLEGFDTMVHLTDSNEFIVLEGDEYLSSAIDKRPKFHLYKANIALISGIAWDHINVFPSFENYIEQFSVFIESLTQGGILVYNAEDKELKKKIELSNHSIKKYPYCTPKHFIKNNITYLNSASGEIPLEIFGKHNLQNLAGAKWICQHMGIDEEDFYEAISSFKGAANRLEKIVEHKTTLVFKDFAHSPSKVKASTKAVKEQYKDKKLVACLELHTYSSLNDKFLSQYKDALYYADKAVVFYSDSALKIKKLQKLTKKQIADAFKRSDLIVYTNLDDFKEFLTNENLKNTSLLLMSSGNYGNLDLNHCLSVNLLSTNKK